MPILLYYQKESPPSRFVATVAKVLGLDVTIKFINVLAGDHVKPEYVKINPERTIPSLDDNGFILCESHAIGTYLVSHYGKDDSLYPKDIKKRALVDQRLYFNATNLFVRLRSVTIPVLFKGKNSVDADTKKAIYETLDNLEKYLQPTGWVAGDHVTLADIACAVNADSMEAMGVDFSGYQNIRDWLQRLKKSIPVFEKENNEGVKALGDAVKSRMIPNGLAR